VIELWQFAHTCHHRQFLDNALRHCFVCGISNHNTRKKLLAEKELASKWAIEVAVAAEMAVLQLHKEVILTYSLTDVVESKDIMKQYANAALVLVLNVGKKVTYSQCAKGHK